jgi:hypothetical protein
MSILDAFYSLGKGINKTKGKSTELETQEGVVSEKFPELKLEMPNEELIDLTRKWKKTWEESEVYSEWKKNGDENENYWKGKHYEQPTASIERRRELVDNAIFEALETYLPQVTRRNPDPMVKLSEKEEQNKANEDFTKKIQKELAEIADELVFRLKLKKSARHWAIYLLGVGKVGWDLNRDIPTFKVIRPRKIILDPTSTVEEDGYTGKYIGEYRKLPADEIISIIESVGGEDKAVDKITGLATDKDNKVAMSTEINFIEWWTSEYLCWTIDDQVLLKKKNPHWNYDSEEEAPYTDQGQPQIDAEGKPVMNKVPGVNHFPVPGMPFVLLSVFNLGKQPVDDTSLMGQNLSNQDLINKRNKQIDKNADSMNGGMVVSLERSGLTKSQAEGVTEAVRRGGTVVIPAGAVSDAIVRMSAPSLPADIYNQLQDTRVRVMDIFGTRGSSPAGLESEETVRGKMQNRLLDTDRIGGGFSEYLEQYADAIYNWFVQLLYVYDERYRNVTQIPKIRVSVKEGSLLPKDSMTIANQAIDLATQNKMSTLDLYKALDYPNPEELAVNSWLENNAPEILLGNDPRVQQAIQAKAGAGVKPPSESISFKDLPPEGKSQMAAQAGIDLNPEAIAAHDEMLDKKEISKDIIKESGKRSISEESKPAIPKAE